MNIVILAAGLGKRMRSALPKVMHPVAGRPMLAHVIDAARATARALGRTARLVVVVGHGADQVRAAFGEGREDAGDLQFVLQQPQLGTGHALMQAAPCLDDEQPTLVLYGDVPLVRPHTLTRLAKESGERLGILTVHLPDPTGYGRVLRDAQGRVTGIVEQRDATEQQRAIDEVNTGILVAPTRELKRWLGRLSNRNAQQEYYLTDVVALAVGEGGQVASVVAPDPDETLGVNSKSQLAHLERVAQRHLAERVMQAGATLADPARIDIRGELHVGVDVCIDVGCVFEGRVELGDRVRVGPYCVLRDTAIGADTEVAAYSHFDGARAGAHVRIGPFSRLRPGAELEDEAHIGNFVEVKASRIGRGAKANHLAYIGDASVGARANIGAGTIVANYDGANKHRTVIGDDVHVGSNTVLVAPLSIGAGATIGAGSTLSRDAPAGRLTVARARAVTIDGWKRPVKKPKPAGGG
ncbi:MAG TPA: bifunctional UDP-N-acetylglucosamine diphosphorylase/glucosamine-1-phosphate N-acetyltransferase GlmU [Burkholderiaceae bacterium]